jgi:hypothetical protein
MHEAFLWCKSLFIKVWQNLDVLKGPITGLQTMRQTRDAVAGKISEIQRLDPFKGSRLIGHQM